LFAAVNGAATGGIAAAWGLGDAPVDGQVAQLQPDHAVIGSQDEQLQLVEDAQRDPLVATVA
jgi:hypothetical protein